MDPRAINRQKKDQFRKEIRNQQIEKKKDSIRRSLPYYQPMFNNNNRSDDDSNGTNSRSSRFPVPDKRSKQLTQQGSQQYGIIYENRMSWTFDKQAEEEREKQTKYIEYLRNLKHEDWQERQNLINNVMTEKYGENCLNFMSELCDQILIDLQTLQQEMNQESNQQFLGAVDWKFVIAAFYLAEKEKYTEIINLSFAFTIKYFPVWYQFNVKIQISRNSQLNDFFCTLAQFQQDKLKIQEIILSQFILVKEQQNIDEEISNIILTYFSQKLDIFLELENIIKSTYDNELIEFFSEMMFDFGSLYFVQNLFVMLSQKESTYEMKINIFIFLNKYYSKYPANVLSLTQTKQKFIILVKMHLEKMKIFYEVMIQRGVNSISIDSSEFEFINSSLKLLMYLYWRGSDSQDFLFLIIDSYHKIVEISIKLQLASEIVSLVEFHEEILQFFLVLQSSFRQAETLFEVNKFTKYFNTLLIKWNGFKMNQRYSTLNCLKNEQDPTQFQSFEFYLIQCLHVTKNIILSMDERKFQAQQKKYIEAMFKHAQFIYTNQIQKLKNQKRIVLSQVEMKQFFLFENNIHLYFHLFQEQTENLHNYNPEDLGRLNGQRDVEI